MIRGAMMAGTVMLLKMSPFFLELTTKKIIPADSEVLLKKVLVAVWVKHSIDLFITEELKEAFK
jgi:hypothetical protein